MQQPGDRFDAACTAFEERMARNFRRQRRLYVVVYLLLVVPLYVSLALTLWLAHEHALVPHS